jgi:hypothetical protein
MTIKEVIGKFEKDHGIKVLSKYPDNFRYFRIQYVDPYLYMRYENGECRLMLYENENNLKIRLDGRIFFRGSLKDCIEYAKKTLLKV